MRPAFWRVVLLSPVAYLIVAAFVLAACNTLAPTFSGDAYRQIADVDWAAEDMSSRCGVTSGPAQISADEISKLAYKVGLARTEARNLTATKEIVDADTQLYGMLTGMEAVYAMATPPSATYCRDKLADVQVAADKILHVYGGLK